MTTNDVFHLTDQPARVSWREISRLANRLSARGSLTVTLPLPIDEVGPEADFHRAQDELLKCLSDYGLAPAIRTRSWVKRTTAGGINVGIQLLLEVESRVIHFVEPPWTLYQRNQDLSLIEMTMRQHPFTAVYIFPGRSDEVLCGASSGRADLRITQYLAANGAPAMVRVIRVEVPATDTGQCRIDLRIEPRKESE